MPFYDFQCPCGERYEKRISYQDVRDTDTCACGKQAKRILFYGFTVYGTDKFSEAAFSDASEASGMKITNTKQIDKLEKDGFMYAVTNPSRHQSYKDNK